MDKIEEAVGLIIEYIEQILSDDLKETAKMDIDSTKIDGETYKTLEIYVENGFERHINLGIPAAEEFQFFKKLLETLIARYARSETYGISKYIDLLSIVGPNFHGLSVTLKNEKFISLSFLPNGINYKELVDSYNKEIDEISKGEAPIIR